MKSQSAGFTCGKYSDEPLVETLSYIALPTSPGTANKLEAKDQKTRCLPIDGAAKYVFHPQKDDAVNKRFRLRYNPCSDAYHRELENGVLTRVGKNIRGWDRGVYSSECVQRIVDAKNNLVYLERTAGSNTGILTWMIDFTPCGLVIDHLSLKVESRCLSGGDVLIMLASGHTKKTISHMEGLGLVDVKEFQNSSNLVLSIHLIGETIHQETRLFERNVLSKDAFPLDLKVTLKPPIEMYNKPILLLGLMFSNSQETEVDRRHYRSHSNSPGRGYLHINIVQGKNILRTKDGLPEPQVKCYLLPDNKHMKSCKTKRAEKSSSPIWDEYFVIDGVSPSHLRNLQLGIRVVNWHLGLNKKNSLLGELRIGCGNVFDFQSFTSPIITSPSSQMGRDNVVYSPLLRDNDDQQKIMRPYSINGTKQRHSRFFKDSGENKDAQGTKKDCTDVRPGYESKSREIVENLKKSNTSSKQTEKVQNFSDEVDIHVSTTGKVCQAVVSDCSNNNNYDGKNNNSNNNDLTTQEKMKPPRPPPPVLSNLNDGQRSPMGNFSHRQYHSFQNTSVSTPKVTTPTFSRLLSDLPMSPKTGRRLSWGGESDMSLGSPRSMKSPTDHQSAQSADQWVMMINKPKQWIYCWQTLVVALSD